MDEVHHSIDLDLTYTVLGPSQKSATGDRRKTMRLDFEDGTVWTLQEALYASWEGLEGDDLRAIHRAKRAFGGDLLTDRSERYAISNNQPQGRKRLNRLKQPSLSA